MHRFRPRLRSTLHRSNRSTWRQSRRGRAGARRRASFRAFMVEASCRNPFRACRDKRRRGSHTTGSRRSASIEIDDIDRLAHELGLDLTYVDTPAEPADPSASPAATDEEDIFDFGAALDRARNAAVNRGSVEPGESGVDAEAIREAADCRGARGRRARSTRGSRGRPGARSGRGRGHARGRDC